MELIRPNSRRASEEGWIMRMAVPMADAVTLILHAMVPAADEI
jgi:hypothetical protein